MRNKTPAKLPEGVKKNSREAAVFYGKIGGARTLAKHGKDYFRDIALAREANKRKNK